MRRIVVEIDKKVNLQMKAKTLDFKFSRGKAESK